MVKFLRTRRRLSRRAARARRVSGVARVRGRRGLPRAHLRQQLRLGSQRVVVALLSPHRNSKGSNSQGSQRVERASVVHVAVLADHDDRVVGRQRLGRAAVDDDGACKGSRGRAAAADRAARRRRLDEVEQGHHHGPRRRLAHRLDERRRPRGARHRLGVLVLESDEDEAGRRRRRRRAPYRRERRDERDGELPGDLHRDAGHVALDGGVHLAVAAVRVNDSRPPEEAGALVEHERRPAISPGAALGDLGPVKEKRVVLEERASRYGRRDGESMPHRP